ncbi:hypothetical protein M2451_002589 [Dysgonomonas sp. PFB1-18]|uniref:hypothetical protein n=1 Tax=unclassified Dysgonomonas TaxID=2630389 RepID=UPI002474990C|nr:MULTISPECIES: hypothetical protein [unclassified Dysgonomonas]MDH6308070.1 hypothetical protein [Dysgonomonas sp. PF1-14]MDH6339609.1 hypothetical protein [Dysgonomonas sp. PF1-16]MDH6381260.1 hypothetical protein [Dysgonomonas sp. PFB1-18]MDH6398472.1 hypothetical protein [Dysgonomonas sp. PF1-23]
MRYLTEANAKTVIEALEEKITELQQLPKKGLRLQNKIRLMQIALSDLQKNKIKKNGSIKSK